MVGRKNKVTCARCDTVVEVDGGIEIDNVEGDMTFGFSS